MHYSRLIPLWANTDKHTEPVLYNGLQMAEGWPERIDAAQQLTTEHVHSDKYKRIPYGNEPKTPLED